MTGLASAIAPLVAAFVALMIYFDRRYHNRKRVASVLLEEIKNNQNAAQGQIPHFDQHGITGTSFDSNPVDYSAGDIPPAARLSSKVYESSASEITRFDPDLARSLVSYYHQLSYLKTLNDIVHEGKALPTAAYNILRINWESELIHISDLEEELKIEMKLFPSIYRKISAIREWRKK